MLRGFLGLSAWYWMCGNTTWLVSTLLDRLCSANEFWTAEFSGSSTRTAVCMCLPIFGPCSPDFNFVKLRSKTFRKCQADWEVCCVAYPIFPLTHLSLCQHHFDVGSLVGSTDFLPQILRVAVILKPGSFPIPPWSELWFLSPRLPVHQNLYLMEIMFFRAAFPCFYFVSVYLRKHWGDLSEHSFTGRGRTNCWDACRVPQRCAARWFGIQEQNSSFIYIYIYKYNTYM